VADSGCSDGAIPLTKKPPGLSPFPRTPIADIFMFRAKDGKNRMKFRVFMQRKTATINAKTNILLFR